MKHKKKKLKHLFKFVALRGRGPRVKIKQYTVYLAGPMRGRPYLNFMQFDAYKVRLEMLGLKVISPADIDRQFGFDPFISMTKNFPKYEDCLLRDIAAIVKSDAVVVMPGAINKSDGTMMELAAAIFLRKPIYQLPKIK